MKKSLIFCLMLLGCDTSSDFSRIEIAWLTTVNNTSWANDTQTISFDSSGETITLQDNIQYNYNYSTNSTTGVYTTMIEFPPTEWYLFVLDGDSTLIRYGGFLESNLIVVDNDKKLVFTKK